MVFEHTFTDAQRCCRTTSPLLSGSGASRTAFSSSLSCLIDLDLLERNLGYGRPLRPEFRLTQLGTEFGAIAHKITTAMPDERQFSMLRRTWAPRVLVVSHQPKFFSEIKSTLNRITDCALSQSLQHLQTQGWLLRDVDTSLHPPRPLYQATNKDFVIAQSANPSTA